MDKGWTKVGQQTKFCCSVSAATTAESDAFQNRWGNATWSSDTILFQQQPENTHTHTYPHQLRLLMGVKGSGSKRRKKTGSELVQISRLDRHR